MLKIVKELTHMWLDRDLYDLTWSVKIRTKKCPKNKFKKTNSKKKIDYRRLKWSKSSLESI